MDDLRKAFRIWLGIVVSASAFLIFTSFAGVAYQNYKTDRAEEQSKRAQRYAAEAYYEACQKKFELGQVDTLCSQNVYGADGLALAPTAVEGAIIP